MAKPLNKHRTTIRREEVFVNLSQEELETLLREHYGLTKDGTITFEFSVQGSSAYIQWVELREIFEDEESA